MLRHVAIWALRLLTRSFASMVLQLELRKLDAHHFSGERKRRKRAFKKSFRKAGYTGAVIGSKSLQRLGFLETAFELERAQLSVLQERLGLEKREALKRTASSIVICATLQDSIYHLRRMNDYLTRQIRFYRALHPGSKN